MALESLTAVSGEGLPGGAGGAAADIDQLVAAVKELQRLKVSVVAGAAADTNIAIAGIATVDTILAVLRFDIAADTGTDATGNKVADLTDLTAEAAITSAGNIQLADTATTGDKLLVLWFDKA